MGIGKASVYKYIPNFFPTDVGAVGGLVGMLGALGGFVLPPLFGWMGRATGSPQSAFVALLVPTVASLAWLHSAVLAANAKQRGERVAVPLHIGPSRLNRDRIVASPSPPLVGRVNPTSSRIEEACFARPTRDAPGYLTCDVSPCRTSPVSSPLRSQYWRCADVPCVNESGTT